MHKSKLHISHQRQDSTAKRKSGCPVRGLLSSSFCEKKSVLTFMWDNGIDGQYSLTRFMEDLYPEKQHHVEFEEKGGKVLFSISS